MISVRFYSISELLKGEKHFEYAYKNGNCKLRTCGSNSWTTISDVILTMCD